MFHVVPRGVSPLQNVQTGSKAHPATCSVGSGGEVAGAWSCTCSCPYALWHAQGQGGGGRISEISDLALQDEVEVFRPRDHCY